MTTVEFQSIVAFTVVFIVLMVSLIPECMLVTYESFKKAPVSLKIYTVIHVGIIIAIVLYLNWIRPSSIYLGM